MEIRVKQTTHIHGSLKGMYRIGQIVDVDPVRANKALVAGAAVLPSEQVMVWVPNRQDKIPSTRKYVIPRHSLHQADGVIGIDGVTAPVKNWGWTPLDSTKLGDTTPGGMWYDYIDLQGSYDRMSPSTGEFKFVVKLADMIEALGYFMGLVDLDALPLTCGSVSYKFHGDPGAQLIEITCHMIPTWKFNQLNPTNSLVPNSEYGNEWVTLQQSTSTTPTWYWNGNLSTPVDDDQTPNPSVAIQTRNLVFRGRRINPNYAAYENTIDSGGFFQAGDGCSMFDGAECTYMTDEAGNPVYEVSVKVKQRAVSWNYFYNSDAAGGVPVPGGGSGLWQPWYLSGTTTGMFAPIDYSGLLAYAPAGSFGS